jgi:hypothetical protein
MIKGARQQTGEQLSQPTQNSALPRKIRFIADVGEDRFGTASPKWNFVTFCVIRNPNNTNS